MDFATAMITRLTVLDKTMGICYYSLALSCRQAKLITLDWLPTEHKNMDPWNQPWESTTPWKYINNTREVVESTKINLNPVLK